MKKLKLILLVLAVSITSILSSQNQKLPTGFVYLNDVEKTIKTELRYISYNNFIGKPIDGYINTILIVSEPASQALKKVQEKLLQFNLSLKIFDSYRPQQAVDHFVRWAEALDDTKMKAQYYPEVPKNKLFESGYISKKSGHTRGSTVDLTIIDLATNTELDMGSPYDFFGSESHAINNALTKKQRANRLLLRNLMTSNGFKAIRTEWWHFTLKDEPFPDTYFNFPIK